MASNKDSFGRTLFVVVGLCLICSVLVSTAAVLLKPIQQENKLLDKQKYILEAANLINTKEGKITKQDILSKYNQYVEARLVDLKTGDFVKGDANAYDQRKASRNPDMSSVPEHDIASMKRVADKAVVYLVRNDDGKLTSVILPVHGYGLWSTMYAFLSLEADLSTVQGLVYYDQGETHGLGGEVENPKWKALWKDKQLYDAQNNLAISVTKNPVVASSVHGVDALSGATLTSNGVQHSLEFWLGKEGFANFIAKARNGGLS